MRIDIDKKLSIIDKPKDFDKDKFTLGFTDIVYDYSDIKNTPTKSTTIGNCTKIEFLWPVKSQSLFHLHDDIPNVDVNLHKNYLEYLDICWANHYGVVLTPDIVWYTLLCEMTLIIAEKPEKFRDLFTTKSEKVEIVVDYELDDTMIPLDAILEELLKLIPSSIGSEITGDFSTTTPRSRHAKLAAFADAVSPYYCYSIKSCGIPFVELQGTEQDWIDLQNRWTQICLSGIPSWDLSDKVYNILNKIVSSFRKVDDVFWQNMFYMERCGSGSDRKVYGWFTDLFYKQPEGIRKVCNFSSHVSNVNYKNIETKRNFIMKQGLFYSVLKDNVLNPDFSYIVFEKK